MSYYTTHPIYHPHRIFHHFSNGFSEIDQVKGSYWLTVDKATVPEEGGDTKD